SAATPRSVGPVGATAGGATGEGARIVAAERPAPVPVAVSKLIAECADPIARIEDAEIDGLLERIGDARVVLLGEATHGTSEFYRMRTRITQQLILRHG